MRYIKQPCRIVGTRSIPEATHVDSDGNFYSIREIPISSIAIGPAVVTDISDMTAIPPVPPKVPSLVTPLQMRKALRLSGLKASVDAALSQAPETIQEEWEYATEVLRNNANLIAVAYSIGKTDADIDSLFVLAGKQ
jgi:hypothetical protein